VTTEAAAADALADDGRMFCYRHPTTETWLRCGRCDQPICVKCSVQGPVGSRCRQCGRVANDPLTSFTPRQLVLGTGAALAGGAVGGFVAGYIGFFSIIVGYFAGRFVADFVIRIIGYKRGPIMLSIVFGGILVGTLLGFGFQYLNLFAGVPAEATASLLSQLLPGALISAGAACFGAYQRLH
jgi:hypothetical protein